jgi:hypothetical protein
MYDLADVAQRLRAVRDAHRRFLALYAVQVAIVEPGLDRIAQDMTSGNDDFPDWLPPDGPASGADEGGGPASHGW